jgi:hypothetical protein
MPLPAVTHLFTRRLVEERTRREVPAMAAVRPLLSVPSEAGAGSGRRVASTARDESARFADQATHAVRTPAQPDGPQLDVERLTDQVVRRIDERIVAYRERMGKSF